MAHVKPGINIPAAENSFCMPFRFQAVRLIRSFFLSVLLATCLIGADKPVLALDPEKLFPQRLDDAFIEQLMQNKGQERAVFFSSGKREVILYMRFSGSDFILRGQFEPAECELIEGAFNAAEVMIFSPTKADGNPLYRKGKAWHLPLRLSGGRAVQMVHVPRVINGIANDCFVSDAGYIEIRLGSSPPSRFELDELLKKLSGGAIKISSQVALNRYYMHRDNYFGPVDRFAGADYSALIAGPIHKVTYYKFMRDNSLKKHKDRDLTIGLLTDQRFLFSQDMRLKLGLVPGNVFLKPENIENSDIGSGQNHMVFLSLGPGINYFDDPWQKSRENVPCPRMVFHRDACRYEKMQVFPTYSIEPEAKGIGRLQVINSFQKNPADGKNVFVEAVWADELRKRDFFGKIEDALCLYGLLNDSPELEPGFNYENRFFKGNVVNNELRLYQALAVRDLMTAVIIPPGMKKSYISHYCKAMQNRVLHWEFNCGVHFDDLFVEAAEASDKAFRLAWLMLVLRETHPGYFRLLQNARSEGRRGALMKIARFVADQAAVQGRRFFATPYFNAWQKLDYSRNQLWLDYLEACRENRSDAALLLEKYRKFYDRMRDLCR